MSIFYLFLSDYVIVYDILPYSPPCLSQLKNTFDIFYLMSALFKEDNAECMVGYLRNCLS